MSTTESVTSKFIFEVRYWLNPSEVKLALKVRPTATMETLRQLCAKWNPMFEVDEVPYPDDMLLRDISGLFIEVKTLFMFVVRYMDTGKERRIPVNSWYTVRELRDKMMADGLELGIGPEHDAKKLQLLKDRQNHYGILEVPCDPNSIRLFVAYADGSSAPSVYRACKRDTIADLRQKLATKQVDLGQLAMARDEGRTHLGSLQDQQLLVVSNPNGFRLTIKYVTGPPGVMQDRRKQVLMTDTIADLRRKLKEEDGLELGELVEEYNTSSTTTTGFRVDGRNESGTLLRDLPDRTLKVVCDPNRLLVGIHYDSKDSDPWVTASWNRKTIGDLREKLRRDNKWELGTVVGGLPDSTLLRTLFEPALNMAILKVERDPNLFWVTVKYCDGSEDRLVEVSRLGVLQPGSTVSMLRAHFERCNWKFGRTTNVSDGTPLNAIPDRVITVASEEP